MSRIKIVFDPLGDLIPKETEHQLHDRIFDMTKVSALAFGIDVEDQQFIDMYRRTQKSLEAARRFSEHINLMSALMLKDLLDTELIAIVPDGHGKEEAENAVLTLIRRIAWVVEHIGFAENVFKDRRHIENLPEDIRQVQFTFVSEKPSQLPAMPEYSEEEFWSMFEDLDAPEEDDDDK